MYHTTFFQKIVPHFASENTEYQTLMNEIWRVTDENLPQQVEKHVAVRIEYELETPMIETNEYLT